MINKIEEVEVEKILLPEEEIQSPGGDDVRACNFHSNQTRNSFRARCQLFFENFGKKKCFNRSWSKKTICNGDIKESVETCGNEATVKSGNGGSKKWVVAMLILGFTDLILTLAKFAMCSETEESTPRLFAGFLDYTAVSKNDLWLPLCIFTIVGSILFFPEFANTLSALFRSDGTTSMPLHVELLITLVFKYVPLATISYFTSKWWSSHATGHSGSALEAAVTSSRIMFVSLRIVWYAHMEGIKVRKNDKYELKQVLFMLCCLLFSITLAVPVMNLKLGKEEQLQKPWVECSEVNNLWITTTWENSCLKHLSDDSSVTPAFNDGQFVSGDETPWKVYTSQSNDPNPKFHFQKCLNISVCDLFNSANKEFLVVYECQDEPHLDSNQSSTSPSYNRICLLGMNRFVFRFYYHTFHVADKFDIAAKLTISGWSNERPGKATDKSSTNKTSIDAVLYTMAGFCTNNPHECHLFDSKTIEHQRNESGNRAEQNGDDQESIERKRHTDESLLENLFRFATHSNEEFFGDLKPGYADHYEMKVEDSCLVYLKLEGFPSFQTGIERSKASRMCNSPTH